MRYRWLMPLIAMTVLAQSPEERLARRLEHESQFQSRFARLNDALRNLQIAEWLAPNAGRQVVLQRGMAHPKKGDNHGFR